MKKIIFFTGLLMVLLVGCSSQTSTSKQTTVQSSAPKQTSDQSTTKKQTPAPSPAPIQTTVDEVISAIQKAGLDAKNPKDMTKDDYGMAPMTADAAKIIILPSVCSDCTGRVFSFKNQADLNQTKAYYDDLGKQSAMFFSWTIAKDNILVELNGDMKKDEELKYVNVVNSTVK